ncbi:hypothetical protein D3C84_1001710 [compost metagenome]
MRDMAKGLIVSPPDIRRLLPPVVMPDDDCADVLLHSQLDDMMTRLVEQVFEPAMALQMQSF